MAKKTVTSVFDVKTFYKKLQKRYTDEPAVLSHERKILDHLVFAIFLENASFGQARAAFVELQRHFIDWNEIRVSTASEIANVVPMTTDSLNVGERLRRTLQWLFDKTYKFDLEDIRAKGSDEIVKFLNTVPYVTRFMCECVSFLAIEGKDVPLDEYSLRVLRLLGGVVVAKQVGAEKGEEREIEVVKGLKNAFKDSDLRKFFFSLHELGVELASPEKREDVLKFLRSLDPDVDSRSEEPLVVSSEPIDPREIARRLRPQRQSGQAMPTSIEADDEFGGETEEDVEDDVESFVNRTEGGLGEIDSVSVGASKTRSVRRSNANEETELNDSGSTYRNNDNVTVEADLHIVKKVSRKRVVPSACPDKSKNQEKMVASLVPKAVKSKKKSCKVETDNKTGEGTATVEVSVTTNKNLNKSKNNEEKANLQNESDSLSTLSSSKCKRKSEKGENKDVSGSVELCKKSSKHVKASNSKDVELGMSGNSERSLVAKSEIASPKKNQKLGKSGSCVQPEKQALKVEEVNKSGSSLCIKKEKNSVKDKVSGRTRKTSSEPPDVLNADVGKTTTKRSVKRK